MVDLEFQKLVNQIENSEEGEDVTEAMKRFSVLLFSNEPQTLLPEAAEAEIKALKVFQQFGCCVTESAMEIDKARQKIDHENELRKIRLKELHDTFLHLRSLKKVAKQKTKSLTEKKLSRH